MPKKNSERSKRSNHLILLSETAIGAGGGTRTHTTFYGPRILSPVRLPFRHTGFVSNIRAVRHVWRRVFSFRRHVLQRRFRARADSYAMA